MAGGVDVRKLTCEARVHLWLTDRRYVSRRCDDRRCREAQWAKQRGQIAIHVWDTHTDEQWTTYDAIDKEPRNGRNC